MSSVIQHEAREVQTSEPERTGNATRDMVLEAMRSGQPIEVIREIRELAKEMAADEAKQAFDEAVSDAKSEIQPIVKNRPGHNSRYADLGEISRQVDPILSKYGLSVRHRTRQDGSAITVICILSHKLGHFEETELTANPDTSGNKNSIQAIGSTLTYLQRYTKVLAVGIAVSDDDDGRAAETKIETITEDQEMQLREMLEVTNSDEKQFLAIGNLTRLSDMARADFSSALDMLKQRLHNRGRS